MIFSSLVELFRDNILFSQANKPQQDILYPCIYPSRFGGNNNEVVAISDVDISPITAAEDFAFSNLIVLGKKEKSSDSDNETINCLYLCRTDQLQTKQDVCNSVILACRQSDRVINLLQSQNNPHSFSEMLSLAAKHLSLPMYLTDVSGQVVNCSGIPYTSSWETYINTFPDLDNINQYRSLPSQILRTKEPFLCEQDARLSVYACPIMRHDIISNIIIVVSAGRPLSALERALLHEVSVYFSSVAPNLPLQVAPNDVLDYLLHLLLLYPNKQLTENDELILKRRGWYKSHRYCVYCIQFQTDSISSYALDNWKQILSYHFPQAFVVENSNNLYVIYNLTAYTKLRRKEVMHKILECLNLPFVLVGASSSCQNIEQLCSARLFSEMAIDIGMILDSSVREFEYDRYGIYHLLMTSSVNLDSLVHPLIRLLKDYDRDHRTEYTITLFEYLEANLKPNLAAEKLCIHKNTLDYRIRRIHEISHPRLEEPERVMAFRLSFAVLTYQAKQEAFQQIRKKYAAQSEVISKK